MLWSFEKIFIVVKESVGIIHEGKDFGDYGYVRGYNSGGMWGDFFHSLYLLCCGYIGSHIF